MFDQITRRKTREERQESSLERYFSVFFAALMKRGLCAAALVVTLAGIVIWGNKSGIAKEEREIRNSYSAPEENDKDIYELLTTKEEIIQWPENKVEKNLFPDLDRKQSNTLVEIWRQEEEQRIVKEILEQEEISMLIWQAIWAKGEDWKSLELKAEVLEDRVSLQLSDEAETVFITVFLRQTDRSQSANGSRWDEFEALWQQCEAILHEEGTENYERFSWHMTDGVHREKEILGKFILYQTERGKQGFFRQNGEMLYQVETCGGDLDKGYLWDIQEMKTQIKKLSAIEEEEEQYEWEEPESGLFQSMFWKLWDGRMPAWGVGWDCNAIWDAVYKYLSKEEGMPAWEEIAKTEDLFISLEKDEVIETFSDLKKLPHLKKIEVDGVRQNRINFDLTRKMTSELEALSIQYVESKDLLFLKNLPQLKSLYVVGCGLEDISGIECQKELLDISLFRNELSDISLLKNCKKVKILSLAFNDIKDISALAALTELTEVGIYGNQISDIEPLRYLTKLEKVNLNDNQITDLSPLKDLTKLTALGASYNRISDISPLEGMIKLDNLALDYNEIQDIHVIKNMPLMRYLGLYHNQIKDFSPIIGLTQLLFFSAGENPGQDHIGDLVFVPRLVLWDGLSEKEEQRQEAQTILDQFYPEEALTAEDMVKGDLDGDGIADLAVTAPDETANEEYGDGRKIYLFLGQADGSFQILTTIDTMGAGCGGIYGDPYDGILITDGRLVVKVYGGSNWRWGYTDIYQYENGEMKKKWELGMEEYVFTPGYDFYITNTEDSSRRQYVIAGEWEGESRQLLIASTGETPSPVEKEFAEKYIKYLESAGIILPELNGRIRIGRPEISTGYYDYQLHDRLYDTERLPGEVLLMAAEKYLSEYQELPVPYYTSEEILSNYKTLTGVELPEILFIGKDKNNLEKVKILAYTGCRQDEDGSFEHSLSLWRMRQEDEEAETWEFEATVSYKEKEEEYILYR